MTEPICGKCGGVMTRENARIHPEYFLHDACLPDELRPIEEEYGDLPELTAEERAAVDSLPADFVKHLLAGDRAKFGPDGKFAGWTIDPQPDSEGRR